MKTQAQQTSYSKVIISKTVGHNRLSSVIQSVTDCRDEMPKRQYYKHSKPEHMTWSVIQIHRNTTCLFYCCWCFGNRCCLLRNNCPPHLWLLTVRHSNTRQTVLPKKAAAVAGISTTTRARSGTVWTGMPYRYFFGCLKSIPALLFLKKTYQYACSTGSSWYLGNWLLMFAPISDQISDSLFI